VLYLIHGGGDTAISWSTVGRANDILDNLLAEKKALPMIVVMPSGWTPSGGQVMTADATKDPFNDELMKDIIPFVEANYRTLSSPDNRALSGLSMGGIQTLNIGLHNLGTFRYVAVMSSGWTTEQDREFFYKTEAARIPKYNSALKLFWWGWGETDIARANGLAVIEKFKSQGVRSRRARVPAVTPGTTGGCTCSRSRRSCFGEGKLRGTNDRLVLHDDAQEFPGGRPTCCYVSRLSSA
jgi:enterochelin esterase-like enzyme